MTPILYEANETTFTSYGIGALVDAISCKVTMGEDTQYELTMDYPVDGVFFSELTGNRIIFAKPCQTDDPQPFRIYRITKPINGRVTVDARHISYDMLGIPVLPFKSTSAVDFCAKITSNSLVTNPFTFITDIAKTEDLEFEEPQTARSLLSDDSQTWREIYGGELVFDRYNVKLLTAAGANRGVVIQYGADLIDSKMEENIAAVYTGILPYFYEDGTLVVGTVQNVTGTFLFTRVLLVDVTDYIVSSNPSQADVNAVGQTWLSENPVGLPQISLSLSYLQIDKTVRLYDTITVKIEKMGVDVVAKVSKTVYDVLKERNEKIEIGDVRPTFAVDIYDAARLRHGLLDMRRIKEKSIKSSKMGSGAATERVLADDSVSTWKLQDHAVTEDKVLDAAITTTKIANSAITGLKIADETIDINKVDNTIAGYFNGSLSMSLRASQIRFSGHRLKITSDGYVVTESVQ